ncbi:MAG: L,D-transpeptidase [Lachnospiraceae bacterium]|nr:L,D-transpeptidase [Lachnospiraceae bacterium]
MLKKRIAAVLIICCTLFSGCSFNKTDTADIRAVGLNAALMNYRTDRDLSAVMPDETKLIAKKVMNIQKTAPAKIETEVKTETAPAKIETNVKTETAPAKIETKVKTETAPAKIETKVKTETSSAKNETGAKIETAPEEEDAQEKEWDDLAPTTHMTFEELVGDNGIYEYPAAFGTPDTYKIIVDLKYQVVLVYEKDENGEYTVPVRYMLCSSGANKTSSPVGTFEMKDYRVRFSRFVNTDDYGQYWSLITGRIYFHSILYDSRNASDYITSTWNNLGKNVSHGCIRLSVPDARFIYYNMAPGTIVQIRKGSSSDTETKEIREKLIEGKAKAPSERVTLKAGDIPYTDNWNKDDIPQTVPFVQGHQ